MSTNSTVRSYYRRQEVSETPGRPRLVVDVRDPNLNSRLKDHAFMSDQGTLKAFVNDILETFLDQPSPLSDNLVENFDLMCAVFEELPLERIQHLAALSHRSVGQMIIHLVTKGITVYESLEKTDPD